MLMIATTLILASVLGSLVVSAARKPARFA